jgi:hypothetical protein
MPAMSLEEMLRSSLEGVNRAFQEADKALHAEVSSTNIALAKISGGTLQVKLHLFREDEEGLSYRFLLETNKARGVPLGAFRVSLKGFPILFGQDLASVERGDYSEAIGDSSQLMAFFHNMASNPDSPLIQKVAYLMRKKINSNLKSDPDPEIPF